MRRIFLKNVGRYTSVDDEDFRRQSMHVWHLTNHGYVERNLRVPGSKVNCNFKLHREILGLQPGDGKVVDHINGNPRDNRRENLRIVTHQQNQFNKRPFGKSGFKGVYGREHKGKKYWVVQIQISNKMNYVGIFRDPKTAAKSYNSEAKRLFGKHAYLNEVSE